jgi:hypothetical protein
MPKRSFDQAMVDESETSRARESIAVQVGLAILFRSADSRRSRHARLVGKRKLDAMKAYRNAVLAVGQGPSACMSSEG